MMLCVLTWVVSAWLSYTLLFLMSTLRDSVLECVPFADAENADRLCAIVEALLKEQSDAGSGSASASGKSKVKAAGKAKVKAAGKGKGNAAGKADAETDAGDDAEDESKEAAESEQKKESESDKPKVVIPKLDTKFQRKFNSTKSSLSMSLSLSVLIIRRPITGRV